MGIIVTAEKAGYMDTQLSPATVPPAMSGNQMPSLPGRKRVCPGGGDVERFGWYITL